jgi:hypothetical protein
MVAVEERPVVDVDLKWQLRMGTEKVQSFDMSFSRQKSSKKERKKGRVGDEEKGITLQEAMICFEVIRCNT